ncbi:hypothetical protein ABEF95_005500 [Exophiala dermatitidis]
MAYLSSFSLSSDDEEELPDLAAILAPKPLMPTSSGSDNAVLRRSPRRKEKQQTIPNIFDDEEDCDINISRSPTKKIQRARPVGVGTGSGTGVSSSPRKKDNPSLPTQPQMKPRGNVKASSRTVLSPLENNLAPLAPGGDQKRAPAKKTNSVSAPSPCKKGMRYTNDAEERKGKNAEQKRSNIMLGLSSSPPCISGRSRYQQSEQGQGHVEFSLVPSFGAMALEEKNPSSGRPQQPDKKRSVGVQVDVGDNGNESGNDNSLLTSPGADQHRPNKPTAPERVPVAGTRRYRQERSRPGGFTKASRFILAEARCNDDESDSVDGEDNEDEDTDLSGFIVDDDAELSYHDSSESDGSSSGQDDEDMFYGKRSTTRRHVVPDDTSREASRRRRRLVRGSPARKMNTGGEGYSEESEEDSGSTKGNLNTTTAKSLSRAFRDLALHTGSSENVPRGKREVEVIDLTSSPVQPQPDLSQSVDKTKPPNRRPLPLLEDLGASVKLDPPMSKPGLSIPSKTMRGVPNVPEKVDQDRSVDDDNSAHGVDGEFKTPPATPPRTPPKSKLKSPSKLLSPSKRQTIPQSPHRQSMDAFWDHNVVNEWNDAYSPKKAPATTSPRKRLFVPLDMFSDMELESESEETKTHQHCDSSSEALPSPCLSPRKTRSPTKTSPEKEQKKRLLEEKRATAARKKEFDSRKGQMAVDLLRELDANVANGRLGELSASTGGVQIVWSKTLRSTAGRANWKRAVTKPSGSPVKAGNTADASRLASGIKIQHFASIELAEKIIDCEDRLVNTLAHEFCHLANFMVSNVRDQPHGASFKQWANKVTAHLRQTNVPVWRDVQVTTKHSYVINHKYLWVCVGRPDRTAVMDYLNLGSEGGCGAEYGRHSKSIDVEKHRCGKCKGRLVQVRPIPRASPRKKSRVVGVDVDGRSTSMSSSREGSADTALTLNSGSGSSRSVSVSVAGSVSDLGSRNSSGQHSNSMTGSDLLDSMVETIELD